MVRGEQFKCLACSSPRAADLVSSQRRALPPDAGGFVRGARVHPGQRWPSPLSALQWVLTAPAHFSHFMGTLGGVGGQILPPGGGKGHKVWACTGVSGNRYCCHRQPHTHR